MIEASAQEVGMTHRNESQRAGAKWLSGNGGTQFLQFSHARITRSRFQLGGYLYRVTASGGKEETLYSGSDEVAAWDAAIAKAIA
jgi:hypothetical protein